MCEAFFGVVGGSGFYDLDNVSNLREVAIETPFGSPSDSYMVGELDGVPVAFLPRHGRGHRINPTNLNSKANIWGFKKLGVNWLLAVSAVGSLKESIEPRHIVVPDQLVDRTRSRSLTFYEDSGLVVHAGMAEPFCPILSRLAADAAATAGATVHRGGAYVCIEGPQFSTMAESAIFRSWGASIIGMTAVPEAKLAREAELPYALLALSTDYDVWKGEPVSAAMVVANMAANLEIARQAVVNLASMLPAGNQTSPAVSALTGAIQSDPNLLDDALRRKYGLLIDRATTTSG